MTDNAGTTRLGRSTLRIPADLLPEGERVMATMKALIVAAMDFVVAAATSGMATEEATSTTLAVQRDHIESVQALLDAALALPRSGAVRGGNVER